MGLFEDLHLLICLIAFIYLFRKIKESTQSRVLGVVVAAFVVFFIFFQHVWIAFLFFFVMFSYLINSGFTAGIIEGQMTHAYMGMLGNMGKGGGGGPTPFMPMPLPAPSGGTGSWLGSGGFSGGK
jgi:hypothetical protein